MSSNINDAIIELKKIIENSYCNLNEQFAQELLNSLKENTGNDNFGIVCSCILEQNQKIENVTILSQYDVQKHTKELQV